MLTKTITPILGNENTIYAETVIGTRVEYRLFGILFYKKQLFTPACYGIKSWENYQFRI